jgi:hypothetical protein
MATKKLFISCTCTVNRATRHTWRIPWYRDARISYYTYWEKNDQTSMRGQGLEDDDHGTSDGNDDYINSRMLFDECW